MTSDETGWRPVSASPSIALFALTGIGNPVLRALHEAGHTPKILVTRAESGPYPYCPERDICDFARDLGVAFRTDLDGEQFVAAMSPDIIIVATYHRILTPALLSTARLAFNLHPSLLPKMRGPNPFFWAVRSGAQSSGVTAHVLSNQLDAGDILEQRALDLSPDETQGSLRQRLGDLSAAAAVSVVSGAIMATLQLRKQDESQATYYPRPADSDRMIDVLLPAEEAIRIVRAAAPFPGAILEGRVVTGVTAVLPPTPGAAPGDQTMDAGRLRVTFRDADLLFTLAAG